jgi:hypothetical protein
MENTQIHLTNESDLHKKVVDFVRRFHPNAILIPGLGEYQTNTSLRASCYSKGYLGGQPDLLIINSHKRYQGLALELKTPTGKGIISEKQTSYLSRLEESGYKCIISNDYDEIVVSITNYCKDIVYPCKYCSDRRHYQSSFKLKRHYENFHKVFN